MKNIKLQEPGSYANLPEVPQIKKLPEKFQDEDLLQYVWNGLSAATPCKQLEALIASLKGESAKERKLLYQSVRGTIGSARKKMEAGLFFTEVERSNLSNDIAIMVCLEKVMHNKPIGVIGVLNENLKGKVKDKKWEV